MELAPVMAAVTSGGTNRAASRGLEDVDGGCVHRRLLLVERQSGDVVELKRKQLTIARRKFGVL
jgi:hypothetical protein